jgi:sulfite reductase alpha subunit-like flavoprotein
MRIKLSVLSLLAFASIALPQAPQPAIDAGTCSANSFEAQFFHFRYQVPKGWFALQDNIRMEENRKRYETQLAKALKEEGPNGEAHRTEGDKEITQTHKTEVFPPYNPLVAAPAALTSSNTDQLPRITIFAQKRITMLMEAGDPAKLLTMLPKIKVLRGPENVLLSGHKFVRADFQFPSGAFLSKFTTVVGDYLIEFDLRANNEKDLKDLATSTESVVFLSDSSS